ncbi:translocation/assembly module TamB domain-containing protein [Thiotrichales bacterium 19S9-12]|nr:translocation/assembly module TamB domain-containing protein [Thiotrichales bacterium 19S9-11]MCF6811992.1 translocation/assembly module TamB domain-containing protein [Thiotrichales bacterium 19S9-12]
MKRHIRSISLVLFIFLLGVFFFGVILFYTQIGLRIIVLTSNYFLSPHGITIEDKGLKGNLSDFHLSQLKVFVDGTTVEVKNVNVQWRPQLLISGIFNIKSVKADIVNVSVMTDDDDNVSSDENNQSNSNQFNWPVIAQNIKVNQAKVVVDDHTEVNISNYTSSAKIINQKLYVDNAQFFYNDVPSEGIIHSVMLSFDDPYYLKAKLTLKPNILNTNLSLNASINAPLRQYFAASIYIDGTFYGQDLFVRSYFYGSPESVSFNASQINSSLGLGYASINLSPETEHMKSTFYISLPKANHLSRVDTVKLESSLNLKSIFGTQKEQKKSIKLTNCHFTVNDYRQSCQLDFQKLGNNFIIDEFLIGDNNQFIKANGKLYPMFDFSFQANISNLERFLPNITAKLTANGYLYGTPSDPGVSTLVKLNDITYQDQLIGNFEGKVSLRNNFLESSISYTLPQHLSANLKVIGQKKKNTWSLNLLDSKIESKNFGAWHIFQQQAITLNTEKSLFNAPLLCLLSTNQSLCTSFSSSHYLTKVKLETHIDPSPFLNLYLTKIIASLSLFNTKLSYYRYTWLPPWITLQAKLSPMEIHINDLSNTFDKSKRYTNINNLAFSYNQFDTAAFLDARIKLNNKSELALNLGLSNVKSINNLNNAHIYGNLNTTLENLAMLNFLVPYPINFSGNLTSHLTFSDQLLNPNIQGVTNIQNGTINLYNYNSEISNIILRAEGKDRNWVITGSGINNNNTISLKSNINWQKKLTLTSNLKGSKVQIANIPPLNIIISPDIQLNYDDQLKLLGSIKIDHANIKGDNLPNLSNSSQMQADIIYLNAQDEPITTMAEIPLLMRLKINFGDDTKFYGFGLKSFFTGEMTIEAQPHQNSFAIGKIYLKDAIYSFYGKQFQITEDSTATFTNSKLDNPYLNVTANYQIPAQQQLSQNAPESIGVHILGTLKNPNISFFSTPSMSQANILSYIIIGQSLDNSDNFSKDQQQQLSSAALALALNGGSSVVLQDVQSKFGITDISFGTIQQGQILTSQLQTVTQSQTGNQNNTALFIGKSLSPHLYVNYGVGIFTGEQLVQAIYRFNKNWQFQTDYTNLDTGADIIYHFAID